MAKPVEIIQHLQVILHLTELEAELDRLALDGWNIVSCFPLHANTLELGEGAKVFCLLKRIITP